MPKKSIAISAVLFMSLLMVISGKWLLAEIYYYQANAYMDSWDSKRQIPSDEWEIARKALVKALALGPHQAVYYGSLGELLFSKSADGSLNPAMSVDLQTQALDASRHAVRLRPSWPYSWAQLALIKYRSSGMDGEVAQALDRSMMLGAWEPSVQLIAAEIGLASWNSLSPELKAKLIDTMALTVQPQSGQILEMIKNLDMLGIVCDRVKFRDKWEKTCLDRK